MLHAIQPGLPAPRSTVPTVPFGLEEFARQSSLPDADDDLTFESGPPLASLLDRVPRRSNRIEAAIPRELAHLFSLVDGLSPVSLLVQLVGPDCDAALVLVCELYARGLVTFDE